MYSLKRRKLQASLNDHGGIETVRRQQIMQEIHAKDRRKIKKGTIRKWNLMQIIITFQFNYARGNPEVDSD